jgi:hypothetical protein
MTPQNCCLRSTTSSDSFFVRILRSSRRSVSSSSLCLISANSLYCSRNVCLACQRTPYYVTSLQHSGIHAQGQSNVSKTWRMTPWTMFKQFQHTRRVASPGFGDADFPPRKTNPIFPIEDRQERRSAKIRGESNDKQRPQQGIRAIRWESSKERRPPPESTGPTNE